MGPEEEVKVKEKIEETLNTCWDRPCYVTDCLHVYDQRLEHAGGYWIYYRGPGQTSGRPGDTRSCGTGAQDTDESPVNELLQFLRLLFHFAKDLVFMMFEKRSV